MFTELDLNLVGWLVAFAIGQMAMASDRRMRKIYAKRKGALLPSVAFPIVWFTMYAIVVLSGYFFWFSENTPDQYFTPSAVLYIVDGLLNIAWTKLFNNEIFGWPNMLVLFLKLAVEAAFMALCFISSKFVSGGLWIPYTLWTIVAIVLQYQWDSAAVVAQARPVVASQQVHHTLRMANYTNVKARNLKVDI